MKKFTIVTAILFLLTNILNAQTEQGKFVVSGSSAFSFQNNLESGDASVSQLSFKPTVGYFVIDNLAINLGVSVDFQKEGSYDPDVTTAIAPGLTYYFPTGGTVKPFINGSVGFATNKYTSPYDSNRYTLNGLAYGGGVGAAIFLRNNVSLDLGLQYVRLELSAPNTGSQKVGSNTLGLGVGFSIFF